MIKTKEDLLNTRVALFKGSALVERYLDLAEELGVKVVYSGTDICELAIKKEAAWLCINSKGDSVYHRERGDLADVDFSGKSPINYRELTFADFLPEEDVASEPKYKYENLITDSITELFGLFYKGELYSGVTGHKQIKTIEGLLAGHRDEDIYTREEVKWQDEVLSYSHSCDNRQLAKFVLDYPEDFLEAARIALKSTGELS